MSTNTKLASVRAIKAALRDICETLKIGSYPKAHEIEEALSLVAAHDAEQAQEPVLQDIEQYRMQMAGISTAALGYWKEGDSIHPDYDTLALRDVAKLYAKYDELFKHRQAAQAVPADPGAYDRGWAAGIRSAIAAATDRECMACEQFADELRAMLAAAPAAPAPKAPAKDHRQWLLDKYETGPGEFWGGHP